MCKFLLSFICLLAAFTSFAQENQSYLIHAKVKQGSILLGGSLSASAYTTTRELDLPLGPEEGTNILASLYAKNGYFLMHDFALGLVVSLEHESLSISTKEDADKFRRTMMLAGPFARYYLDNGIFGELSLQAGLLNFSTGDKSNLFQGGIGVGYAYFVNQRISLEPMLSFRYFQESRGGKSNTTLGPMLGFGIQAYILRRRAHIIKEAL
ncbi:autotransporter outer membrane beta-barrel domain-containing protein [Pontibacter russatus]|uniref:autotransporter outer membrane beta-barrel domain-containing protein n=1 Tax=Pontibacter russatus TaxID=2694929 RepID=UPI00137A934C|nr:autotransporter outer membrane beta-barrel domain-containing protein [Pontibacter russatus]